MIRRGRVLPTAAADARRTERIVECARSRGSGAGGGLLTKQLQKRAYHGCGGRFHVTEESCVAVGDAAVECDRASVDRDGVCAHA